MEIVVAPVFINWPEPESQQWPSGKQFLTNQTSHYQMFHATIQPKIYRRLVPTGPMTRENGKTNLKFRMEQRRHLKKVKWRLGDSMDLKGFSSYLA